MFVANFTFAQQNRSANVSSTGAHSFNKSGINQKTNPNAVLTTTTSSCMSVNLPPPSGWSLVNYGTGTPIFSDGFVNGPNIYNDREKAMYFDVSASANTMITQVYVGFSHAYSATPTKTVAVRFYDGTSGTPGASIGQGTLSMSTIMTDVTNNQYSLIIFPTPLTLPVSKRFFASVDLSALSFTTAIKDSLSIVSNTDLQTIPTQTWEKWSTNTWYRYDNVNSWGLDISLLIHPFLTQAPITASITVSTSTICTGQTITYNSTGSTPGTYDWYFGAATTATATGASANTTYTSAGTYTTTMIVEDACGSFGIASGTINVSPSPTANASTSQTLTCLSNIATLNGSGVSTYTWSGPSIVSGGNSSSMTAGAPGTYSLVGTTGGCLSNTATVILTSNTVAPSPSITASSSSICAGGSFTLNASGAGTYSWSTGSTATSIVVSPTTTTNYVLSGTNTVNGCASSTNTLLTVSPLPSVGSTPSSTTVCNGSNVTLSGSGATTYSWTGGITNGNAFTATTSANYTVTGFSAAGCSNTTVATVSVNPLPTVTATSPSSIICGAPFQQTITITGNGASTYTWNTTAISNTISVSPSVTTTYSVTGTDANGCENTSSVMITVSACTGINNVTENIAQFVVYPNPNNGEFTISVTGLDKTPSVQIYNTLGKLVYSDVLTSEKNTFNTNLAAGIYFISIIENNKVIATQKLICK